MYWNAGRNIHRQLPTKSSFHLHNFRLTRNLKVEKKKIITFWKANWIFSMRERKHHEKKFAEEYFWAITQAAGRSCCGRSGFRVLHFGFQMDSLVYIHIGDHMQTQFRIALNFPERHCCCATRGWVVLLKELFSFLEGGGWELLSYDLFST